MASEHNKQEAEAALLEQRTKAVEAMDRLAEKAGDWPALRILRGMRLLGEQGRRRSTPLRRRATRSPLGAQPEDVMVRVNISFDRETLHLADREARRRHTSRSEFIRAVVRREASKSDAAGQELQLRRQRQEAIKAIRRIAREAGRWPTTKIVHDWRYRRNKGDH